MTEDVPGQDAISAYLDGELDDRERDAVAARLAATAEWRAVMAEVREARALVRALPARDAPPGLWRFLEGTLASTPVQPVGAARTSAARPGGSRARRGAVRTVAAVAVAAAIGAFVLLPGRSSTRPPVATFVETHAARSSVSEEPVSQLAPVAVPVRLRR